MTTAKEIQWAIRAGLKLTGKKEGRLEWEGDGTAWYWFNSFKLRNEPSWVKIRACI